MSLCVLKPLKILQLKPGHNLLHSLNPASAYIPHILGPKNILRPIENVPQYRSLTVAQNLRQAINSVPKVEDDSQINISKVAKYREVLKRSNSDSILDLCVKVAIKENIRVPIVSVEITRVRVSTFKANKKVRMQFPGVTGNHVTPLESEIIKRNAEAVRTKLNKDKKQFYEELFLDQSEGSTVKENIVGHYLSQGLEEPRHPGEVFLQLSMRMETRRLLTGLWSRSSEDIIK